MTARGDDGGDDHGCEREAGKRRRHEVGQTARIDRPQRTPENRPWQKAAIRDVGKSHRRVDGEAHSGDIAATDDEEPGRGVQHAPGGLNLLVLLALSRPGRTLAAYLRAIQKRQESPTIAPRAPASMTSSSSSPPSAAIVDAAFSVVSPGKIGITASRPTRRKTMRYAAAADWSASHASTSPRSRSWPTTMTRSRRPNPPRRSAPAWRRQYDLCSPFADGVKLVIACGSSRAPRLRSSHRPSRYSPGGGAASSKSCESKPVRHPVIAATGRLPGSR